MPVSGFDNPAATGGLALAAALLIQYLKNAGWASWFSRETSKANLGLSVAAAFLASVGIHTSWDATTDTFAVIGVVAFLKHGLWQWALQWVAQHAAYKGLVVPAETLGEIRTMLARALTPPALSEGDAKVHGGIVKP